MRNAATILRETGTARILEVTGVESVHTVRSWIQRDSIPAEHWKSLAEAKIASLEELAEIAAVRAAA